MGSGVLARIRTIKPEFWVDETNAKLSYPARLLFIATWNYADDAGRLRWTPEYLKGCAFVYDAISLATVRKLMRELVELGLVVPYVVEKERYAFVANFTKHQTINRPTPARYPDPPAETLDSVRTHGGLSEGSVKEEEEEGEEEVIGAAKAARERRPDPHWDAMVEACGLSSSPTTRERSAWNGALRELKQAGATPDDIRERARAHAKKWPDASLTPTSLARHWSELVARPRPRRPQPKAVVN